MISREEKNLTETKEFMNNLIKQKETIVRQEIVNSEKIIELEGANSHLRITIEDLNTKILDMSHHSTADK